MESLCIFFTKMIILANEVRDHPPLVFILSWLFRGIRYLIICKLTQFTLFSYNVSFIIILKLYMCEKRSFEN